MKKILWSFFVFVVLVVFIKHYASKPNLPQMYILEQYCLQNNYSTDFCVLVDFSKHSGINRFYIYDFKQNKIIYKSLCAQGLGKIFNFFKKQYSNTIGSNYSSLGKYKIGNLRKMSNPKYGVGYSVYGLDDTNSNAFQRGILIHNGNPNFQTFPLPCFFVSKGCFAVSQDMMNNLEKCIKNTNKPMLLYAYN